MYHSLIFFRPEDIDNENTSMSDLNSYTKHTYKDWFLIPTSRPSVEPPDVKTQEIEVPGMNGKLDYTESLLGYPLYENRSGSWEFMVENGHKPWSDLYSEIMDWLNGREMYVAFEDDASWYYKGRFTVDGWDSGDQYSTITIGYDLYPYKRSLYKNNNGWIWDYFDFQNGIIPDEFAINIDSDEYMDVYISSNNQEQWYYIVGSEPVVPKITIAVNNSNTISIKFINNSLKRTEYERTFDTSGVYNDPKILFGGRCLEKFTPLISQNQTMRIQIKGHGSISFDFKPGRM